MHATLLVPDLLWPQPERTDAFTLPHPPAGSSAAAALLCVQPPTATRYQPLEALLAGYLPAGASIAEARWHGETSVERRSDEPSRGALLCADPVHFRFHQELLIAADATTFPLAASESAALVAALNDRLGSGSGTAARFVAPCPTRWYVRLDRLPDASPPPVAEITGRSVSPGFFDAGGFKQLASEIQMLLHADPVNAARESAGQPTINGVWLWGAERRPAGADAPEPPDLVVGDSALCRGLAGLAGAGWRTADAAAVASLTAPERRPCRHALLVREDLRTAVGRDDLAAWQAALADCLHRWLAPLHAAWDGGRLESLTLVAPCRSYGTLAWNWRRRPGWGARLGARWRARSETLAALATRLASGGER